MITFNKAVPNELWVNNFSENLTKEFTYSGPTSLIAKCLKSGEVMGIVEEAPEDLAWDSNEVYVSVIAADEPEVALYLSQMSVEYEYTYTTVTNFDGSTYQEITNPRLSDYNILTYTDGSSPLWIWTPIYKNTLSTIQQSVISDRDKVVSTLSAIALDTASQEIYDAYVSAASDWLTSASTHLPWKFIEFPTKNTAPKVPLTLIRLINEITTYKG